MNDNIPIKSIRYKTLITFSIFSLFTIVFIWLFQGLYFSTVYEKVKANEIDYIGSTLKEIYTTSPNYQDDYLELSLEKDLGILLFEVTDNNEVVYFNTTRIKDDLSIKKITESFVIYLTGKTEASFKNTDKSGMKIYNYGTVAEIDGKKLYFCVCSTIEPLSSTTKNFGYLLIFISIGVFCSTSIGSYYLSNQFALPIMRMAHKAKQLSKNNLDVKFNSDEYAEVKQLSDTLNYAIDELKKTDNLRKEMLANVSHELKTPLTMIKSYTELIQDISGNDPTKRAEHLKVIHDEADRLEFLINDMMDYSKLESGTMTYQKTTFDLVPILIRFKNSYSDKYKDFTITLDSINEAIIYADQKRIEQVITNLLNNAINYSPTRKEINIKLTKAEENKFKLEIIDHGIGISKENIDKIFERHFRTANAKRTTVGSGIGLNIVKSILNYHGYEYGVSSTEGEGSNFYVYFNEGQNDETN